MLNVRGVYNFLGSFLPQQRFETVTSVTAPLQLRVLFGKHRIVHLQGMRAGQPQRRGLNLSLLPLFIHFVFFPLSLPYTNWASQEKGVFVSLEVLTVSRIFFCSIFVGFSLYLLATTILESFFLF